MIAPSRPTTAYAPEVEQWRSLVAKYFPPEQVEKALRVIQGESGGRSITQIGGGPGTGLFQIEHGGAHPGRLSQQELLDPETNVRVAAEMASKNWDQWTDWGEGVTYNGKPFGALGAGLGAAAGSQARQAGATLGEVAGRASIASSRPTTADLFAVEENEERRQIITSMLEPLAEDERRFAIEVYERELSNGAVPGDALRQMRLVLQDELGGNATAVGPMAGKYNLTKPGDFLAAGAAPYQMLGEGLATVADPAIEKLPEPAQRPVRRAVELAPSFAVPTSWPTRAKLAGLGAATAAGEVERQLGGSGAIGETVGGIVGPGLPTAAGPILRMAGKRAKVPPVAQDLEAALGQSIEQARTTRPTQAAAPKVAAETAEEAAPVAPVEAAETLTDLEKALQYSIDLAARDPDAAVERFNAATRRRQTTTEAANKANARLRFSDTGKASLEKTREAMQQAQQALKRNADKPAKVEGLRWTDDVVYCLGQ